MPVYKLGVNYDGENSRRYWYSWLGYHARYRPELYPKFTGKYKGDNLEMLYVRRPTAEPFFPIPDYLSWYLLGKSWGELANAAQNSFKKLPYCNDYY
jgi:hypothetical protein